MSEAIVIEGCTPHSHGHWTVAQFGTCKVEQTTRVTTAESPNTLHNAKITQTTHIQVSNVRKRQSGEVVSSYYCKHILNININLCVLGL